MARAAFFLGVWMCYFGIISNMVAWHSAITSTGASYDLTGSVLIVTGMWTAVSGFLWWALNNG